MSMNIYAAPGSKVVYTGSTDSQVNYIGATDPRPLLVEGQTYTVSRTEVDSWFTFVYLEEVEGEFNSVVFEDAE